MATIYKIELVSHWVNYTEQDLQKILEDALKQKAKEDRNEITVEVLDRR